MKRPQIDHEVLQALTLFVQKLNDESCNGALVVVEGQRDAEALNSVGFKGDLFLLCQKESLVSLTSEAEKYRKVILLFDLDKEGRALTKKAATILQEKKSKIDLFFRRELPAVTKGRVKHIEELIRFRDLLHR